MMNWRRWLDVLLRWSPTPLGVVVSVLASVWWMTHHAPAPHHLLGGGVDPYAWYSNERQNGHFWINDPKYGAKCDGSTDDNAAIVAANTDASLVNGEVDFPPTASGSACMTSAELFPSGGITWRCLSGSGVVDNFSTSNNKGQCYVRALAAVRAVISLHSTSPVSSFTNNPITIQGLTADCNGLAKYGFNFAGAWKSRIRDSAALNCVLDGVHHLGQQQAVSFSAFSQSIGGGSPSLSIGAFSQPDAGFISLPVNPLQLVLKVNTTGALGTATYLISYDGGSTFPSASQLIASASNVCYSPGGPIINSLVVQVAWPSGTYHAGDTYSVTVTQPLVDGTYGTNNADVEVNHVWVSSAGTVSATSGLQSQYLAGFPTVPLLSGTASTTAGSQIVTGAGTSFLTTGMRQGDSLYVGGRPYVVACPEDATDVAVMKGDVPTATGSALDYATGVGACYWMDDDGDEDRNYAMFMSLSFCPTAMRLTGSNTGATYTSGNRIESYGFFGQVYGGVQTAFAPLSIADELKVGVANSFAAYLTPQSAAASIIEPRQAFTPTGPGSATIYKNGNIWSTGATSTAIAAYVQQFVPTQVAVTSASQQLAAPQVQWNPQSTTFESLLLSGDYTMTATPLIPIVPASGTRLILCVDPTSNHYLNLQDTYFSASGLELSAPWQTLASGDCITLESDGQTHWRQVADVFGAWRGQFAHSSASHPGGATFTLSNSSLTTVYSANVSASNGFGPCGMSCDIFAGDVGGVHVGIVRGLTADFDGNCNLLGGAPQLLGDVNGTGTGGTLPTGWSYSVTVSSCVVNFNFQAVSGVKGRIFCRHGAAPLQ